VLPRYHGDTKRVKQLLDGDGGAQVDEKGEYGMTALMIASRDWPPARRW